MAKKDTKKRKGLFGIFSRDKDEEGQEAATPGSSPAGPAPEDDDDFSADMTMPPGYVREHLQPERSGEIGMVSFGSPAAGAPQGGTDPFGSVDTGGLGSGGMEEFEAGEMTMAPGYAGSLGTRADYARPEDPFADAGLSAMTPPGPAMDPTADTLPTPPEEELGMDAAEMTMVPGYAGGADLGQRGDWARPRAGAPSDPFAADPFAADSFAADPGAGAGSPAAASAPQRLPDPFGDDLGAEAEFGEFGGAEMTMAPGYAQGGPGQAGAPDPTLDPFGGAEMTMAPGYAQGGPGQAGAPDPTLDPFGGAEMTMAPGYAQGGPGQAGGPDPTLDPFGGAEMTMAPGYAQGGPGQPGLVDPFGDVGASAAEAAALGAGADPADPFGPALLDQPLANPLASAGEDFSERTMVDMDSDIGELEVLRPTTEELEIGDLGFGEAQPLSAGEHDLFGSIHREDREIVATGPTAGVTLDAGRGLLFAPPREGGWRLPPGLRALTSGAVFAAVRIDEAGAARWRVPVEPEVDAEGLRVPLPPETQHDPLTRALRVPAGALGALGWRPARSWRDAEGALCFLYPSDASVADGVLVLSTPGAALGGASLEGASLDLDAAGASPHGAPIHERSYLGLKELSYADGWASLELGPGAELTSEGIEVDADAPGLRPELIEATPLPGNRLRISLPSAARSEAGVIWLPPAGGVEEAPGPLSESDAAVTVRETRAYLGILDELLESGWVRLTLPPTASLEGRRLCVPYDAGAPAAILGAFDLDAEGRLTFELPDPAEVLGRVVLIPPDGEELVTDTWAGTPSEVRGPSPADAGPRRWNMGPAEAEAKQAPQAKPSQAVSKASQAVSKAEPEVSKAEPEVSKPSQALSKAEPEVSEAEPEVSEAEPEVSKAEPEVSEAEPEVSEAEPEVSEAEPEVSEAEPEVSEAEPEVSEAEPEVPEVSEAESEESEAEKPKKKLSALQRFRSAKPQDEGEESEDSAASGEESEDSAVADSSDGADDEAPEPKKTRRRSTRKKKK